MSDGSSTEAKRLQLNLSVLKRHDASIIEIVASTSYVVLYRYESKAGEGHGVGHPSEMLWARDHVYNSVCKPG